MSRSVVLAALTAGLLAGLVSAPHCLGMCGPLAAYAAMPSGSESTRARTLARPLRWQIGRVLSYATIGAVVGGTGAQALRALAPDWASVAFSAALAIALLVAAARLAQPAWLARLVRRPIAHVRTIGRAPRTPLAARILARAPREPLALGFLTALLPCGALWSGALIAAGSGSALDGAIAMTGFALASGAALFFAGTIGARAIATAPLSYRRGIAAALVVGALITVLRPLPLLTGASDAPHCHLPSHTASSP